jgi:hypothetical protein
MRDHNNNNNNHHLNIFQPQTYFSHILFKMNEKPISDFHENLKSLSLVACFNERRQQEKI